MRFNFVSRDSISSIWLRIPALALTDLLLNGLLLLDMLSPPSLESDSIVVVLRYYLVRLTILVWLYCTNCVVLVVCLLVNKCNMVVVSEENVYVCVVNKRYLYFADNKIQYNTYETTIYYYLHTDKTGLTRLQFTTNYYCLQLKVHDLRGVITP